MRLGAYDAPFSVVGNPCLAAARRLHFIVKGISVVLNSTQLLGRGSRIGDAAFTQRAINNSGVRALTHVQVRLMPANRRPLQLFSSNERAY